MKKKRPAKKTSEIGELFTFVRDHVAHKSDIERLKHDIDQIRQEVRDVKMRIKDIERQTSDHSGHSKEIDHALERIRALEKHVGLR